MVNTNWVAILEQNRAVRARKPLLFHCGGCHPFHVAVGPEVLMMRTVLSRRIASCTAAETSGHLRPADRDWI